MAWGAVVTLVPLLVVSVVGRALMGLHELTLCGLLAGSMTDPPALSFANNATGSEAPSLSYVTVYPLNDDPARALGAAPRALPRALRLQTARVSTPPSSADRMVWHDGQART